MFPVDFRYGWDIGYGPHQRLLRQVHETSLQPEVLMLSPNCRPWSVSSNQRPPEQLQQMREEEEPGLCFIEERCHKQIKMERLYLLEQPWSSGLWKRLEALPGHCARTDHWSYTELESI